MSGWIKIHRCINNHWLYTEKRSFSRFEAWMDILMTVNFANAKVLIKGKLYDVKRGQSILSMENWAKRWNWDKSKVRRFMELLKKDSMIILKTDNTTTHLTVCNFESYQDERHTDKPRTKRKRNTDEHQTTPIEEEQEQEEEEEQKEEQKEKDNITQFIDYESIQLEFNTICIDLPNCTKLTDKRKKAIRSYINKNGLDELITVFEKAQDSDFVSGRTGKFTSCNFDWLLNPNNAIKVLEGNYENKTGSIDKRYDGIMEWLSEQE